MSVLVLRPNADGVCGLYHTGAAHYTEVAEETPDGDTTCVYSQWHTGAVIGDYRDRFTFPPHTTESGTIDKVVWNMVGSNEGPNPMLYAIILVADTPYGWESDEMPESSGYALYSREFATNPDTGVAWTWDDIDAIMAGVNFYPDYHHDTVQRCTQLYLEVYYSSTTPTPVFSFPWLGHFQLTRVTA